MARPQIDNTRAPDGGPHLRFVQIYLVASHVASVKTLKWNGSAFAVYGNAYTIGGYWETGDSGKQLWIVWRSDAQLWQPIFPATGNDKFTIIQGLTTAAVTADLTSFNIDNIELLAGSLDPRVTPGDTAETLSIANSQAETFTDNEPVLAIYSPGFDNWRTLVAERFRSIKFHWYSGTSTLTVDHIVPLESGIDPSPDPTDDTSQISVSNVYGDTYASGDKGIADWNAKDDVWEARPKGGAGSTAVLWGKCTVAGTASTTAGTPTTDCEVTLFADFGGTVETGCKNYTPDDIPLNAAVAIDDAKVIIDWSCNLFE